MRLKLIEPIFDASSLCEISEIELTSQRVGEVKGFPNDPTDKLPRYKHRVFVKIPCKTGDRSASFAFYTSNADYEAGKKKMTNIDLIGALGCIIDDAISGEYSYTEFMYEFGYGDYSPKIVRRIYNECKETRVALEKLGIVDDDTLSDLRGAIDFEEGNFKIQK
jgi:hypothetical protein